jgi:hypothetical protein
MLLSGLKCKTGNRNKPIGFLLSTVKIVMVSEAESGEMSTDKEVSLYGASSHQVRRPCQSLTGRTTIYYIPIETALKGGKIISLCK